MFEFLTSRARMFQFLTLAPRMFQFLTLGLNFSLCRRPCLNFSLLCLNFSLFQRIPHIGIRACRRDADAAELTRHAANFEKSRECQKHGKHHDGGNNLHSFIHSHSLWQQPPFIAMVATTLFIHSFIANNTATLDYY